MMKNKRRGIIGGFIIIGLIVIAVCNVFIHRSFADLTLAIGVIVMGRSCFLNLLKESK